MPPSHGLSVIIIARNEEHDIADCLESVKPLATEIILADSGSTDQTIEIAKRFGVQVFHKEWEGYGPQKQFALDKAKGPWVLNIDADERLSPALQTEIRQILAWDPSIASHGYDIPFRHTFLGKRLRFGGVAGEKHIRLFQKGHVTYGNKKIHEGVHLDSPAGHLNHPIDHLSYRNIEEYLTKCNLYTSLIAQEKWEKGERFHCWHHLRLPMAFFMRYVLKLGFLDGEAGLIYAALSAYYTWIKFLKLRDLEGKK